MADISKPQGHQVASSQFAVKAEIEQRKLSVSMLYLETYPNSPDAFGFQRCLLADQFALIPGFAAAGCGFSAHHDLLKKDGRHRLSSRTRAIPAPSGSMTADRINLQHPECNIHTPNVRWTFS
jgi:hypothetical protein